MLIKDVQKFINAIMIMESMSIKQFRQAIENKDYSREDMRIALDIWKSNPELKDRYALNDFVSNPQSFIDEILQNEELKLRSKLSILKNEKNDLTKKNYMVVHEDENCMFLAIGNPFTNHYISHNFLRQKKDGEKFGSGPTWCIADDEEGYGHWRDYEFDMGNYPLVYTLLSKKDSSKRWQYTFDKDKIENLMDEDYEETEEWDDEVEDYVIVEKPYELEDCVFQVRSFDQTYTEERGRVFENVSKEMGISSEDITKWLRSKKNELYNFQSNTSDENYKMTTRIYDLDYDIDKLNDELIDTLVDEVVEIAFQGENTEEMRDKYGDAIHHVTSIYLKVNKNIKPKILRAVLDVLYAKECGNFENGLRKCFQKYILDIDDISDVVKNLLVYTKSLKNTDWYISFLDIAISMFFSESNPIKVEDMIKRGLIFEKVPRSIYYLCLMLHKFGAYKCIEGDVIDLQKDDEKNKFKNFSDVLKRYDILAEEKPEDIYFLLSMGKHLKNINFNPGMIAKSILKVISEKHGLELYTWDDILEGFNDSNFILNLEAQPKEFKDFLLKDEKFKRFVEENCLSVYKKEPELLRIYLKDLPLYIDFEELGIVFDKDS